MDSTRRTAGDCLQRCTRLAQANGKWRTNSEDWSSDWTRAVSVFEERLQARFLVPIDKLLSVPFAGFVVVALDCLLAETIQSYRKGRSSKSQETAAYFQEFVDESAPLKGAFAASERLKDFHDNVRNALAHDGETRGKWLIERGENADWVIRDTSRG